MALSKFDPSKGFSALNSTRNEDSPDETVEAKRARHSAELDGARASLEQVAGVFPHVGKGGQASEDLADAARNFARLSDRDDEEAKAREADAEKADADAEQAAEARDELETKRDVEDDNAEQAGISDTNVLVDGNEVEVANPVRPRQTRPVDPAPVENV